MEDNLESLFDDVFRDSQQPGGQPADDDGKQETGETAEEERIATGPEAPRNDEEKPPMSKEERAKQAAGRRSRERETLISQTREAERARVNDLLKRIGGIERDDGTVMETVDALETYEREQSDERIAQGRANADDIRRIAQEAVNPGAGDADVEKELEMIREMDPTMTDLGTILQSDIGQDFRDYVEKGATFLQAYGRAIREKNARSDGARAAEAAKAAGKGHLGATKQRGEGALTVPPDELALFRELNPGMSDKEIQDYYNRDKKKFG